MKRFSALAAVCSVVCSLALLSVFLAFPAHNVNAQQYSACNGGTSATPSCQSSASGIVSIAAAAQTVVVSTTAVQATNPIILTYDQSLGTALGVTCNTTAQQPYVSARVTGVSFTIKTGSTFTTNPGCINFLVVQNQ